MSRAPRAEADRAAVAVTGSRSPSRVLAGRSCLCLATALGGYPLVIKWTRLGRLLSRTNPEDPGAGWEPNDFEGGQGGTKGQTNGVPSLSAHSGQAEGANFSWLPRKYHTRLSIGMA